MELAFELCPNFENSMCPRSFLSEETKIKQRTSSKQQLCEIGGEAIKESRFTSFFKMYLNFLGRGVMGTP